VEKGPMRSFKTIFDLSIKEIKTVEIFRDFFFLLCNSPVLGSAWN